MADGPAQVPNPKPTAGSQPSTSAAALDSPNAGRPLTPRQQAVNQRFLDVQEARRQLRAPSSGLGAAGPEATTPIDPQVTTEGKILEVRFMRHAPKAEAGKQTASLSEAGREAARQYGRDLAESQGSAANPKRIKILFSGEQRARETAEIIRDAYYEKLTEMGGKPDLARTIGFNDIGERGHPLFTPRAMPEVANDLPGGSFQAVQKEFLKQRFTGQDPTAAFNALSSAEKTAVLAETESATVKTALQYPRYSRLNAGMLARQYQPLAAYARIAPPGETLVLVVTHEPSLSAFETHCITKSGAVLTESPASLGAFEPLESINVVVATEPNGLVTTNVSFSNPARAEGGTPQLNSAQVNQLAREFRSHRSQQRILRLEAEHPSGPPLTLPTSTTPGLVSSPSKQLGARSLWSLPSDQLLAELQRKGVIAHGVSGTDGFRAVNVFLRQNGIQTYAEGEIGGLSVPVGGQATLSGNSVLMWLPEHPPVGDSQHEVQHAIDVMFRGPANNPALADVCVLAKHLSNPRRTASWSAGNIAQQREQLFISLKEVNGGRIPTASQLDTLLAKHPNILESINPDASNRIKTFLLEFIKSDPVVIQKEAALGVLAEINGGTVPSIAQYQKLVDSNRHLARRDAFYRQLITEYHATARATTAVPGEGGATPPPGTNTAQIGTALAGNAASTTLPPGGGTGSSPSGGSTAHTSNSAGGANTGAGRPATRQANPGGTELRFQAQRSNPVATAVSDGSRGGTTSPYRQNVPSPNRPNRPGPTPALRRSAGPHLPGGDVSHPNYTGGHAPLKPTPSGLPVPTEGGAPVVKPSLATGAANTARSLARVTANFVKQGAAGAVFGESIEAINHPSRYFAPAPAPYELRRESYDTALFNMAQQMADIRMGRRYTPANLAWWTTWRSYEINHVSPDEFTKKDWANAHQALKPTSTKVWEYFFGEEKSVSTKKP